MADDIVQRLRAEHCDTSQCPLCRLLRSAADEIERLRAENAAVLDLPDAEHIHVTRRADGGWDAVPMERVGWCWPHEEWPVMRMMLPDDGAPPPPRVGLRAMFADAPAQGDGR